MQADVVIVGAELSSLSTAIAAAERGFSVVVVYAGPLGGLSADTGGNLRYFDVMTGTSHPPCQLKLFRQGLGMGGLVAVPPQTDRRLSAFFGSNYAGRISFVRTRSYDSLHADRSPGRLEAITTDEGVRIRGTYFLDMDPESRVAEKSGIPMDINTPHLSYGVVFDVAGLTEPCWEALKGHELIQPEQIMRLAGVIPEVLHASQRASHSRERLTKELARDFTHVYDTYAYGYCALAQGFDFYMQCRELVEPSDDLRWLNERRCMSGFNISKQPRAATFNSVSYRLAKNILQHSHSLHDDDFAPIRRTEIPALQAYLHYVTGSDLLRVRMPNQFYVRKATAFFSTLHPYQPSEFNLPPSTPFHTHYLMDLRDLSPRDNYGWRIVVRNMAISKGKYFWECRPSATYTRIQNLFLVNKCAATPAFFGGQRIEGNQINLGAALIESLAPPGR
jgi:hypothetical protein